ncbi:hypothetical protein ACFX2I_044306 [Malus domestica]|uniref:Transmembrane protein n=1 Tax=Malus domestica TaxID=3750 RepID=A0A498JBF3_MALDO|nr:hypothetical protein DVH24_033362 [Malus domestica]
MNGLRSRHCQRCLQLQILVLLLLSISLLFDLGSADEPSTPKNGDKASSGSAALKAVIVLLGVAAVIGFCVFLFKIWQKKKREEQHARLLKLFEDDDELEVELGIRD